MHWQPELFLQGKQSLLSPALLLFLGSLTESGKFQWSPTSPIDRSSQMQDLEPSVPSPVSWFLRTPDPCLQPG